MANIDDTLAERGKTHGNWWAQAATAQALKHIVISSDGWEGLTPSEREGLEMIMVKVSRILNGNPHEPDHWADISGYSTLVLKCLKG